MGLERMSSIRSCLFAGIGNLRFRVGRLLGMLIVAGGREGRESSFLVANGYGNDCQMIEVRVR